jgi:hypothetical protein
MAIGLAQLVFSANRVPHEASARLCLIPTAPSPFFSLDLRDDRASVAALFVVFDVWLDAPFQEISP